jgi:hypothetical protein
MVSDIKTSKSAFVSILKQEQAADYADKSSQQVGRCVLLRRVEGADGWGGSAPI